MGLEPSHENDIHQHQETVVGMTLETERQLLDAVCSGDRRAMRRLYDRYAGYAMGTALRFIVEEDDVRDVVQDSFVKVFTTIGHFDFRGEGSLKAWINRIVTNQSIDFLKSRQRITFVSDVPDDTADEAPEVELVPSEVLTRLIAKLPTGYRLVHLRTAVAQGDCQAVRHQRIYVGLAVQPCQEETGRTD